MPRICDKRHARGDEWPSVGMNGQALEAAIKARTALA